MRKHLLAAVLFAAVTTLYAQEIKTSPTSERYNLEALGMSANARYITGLNVTNYVGFAWDTQSGVVTENEGDYANCDFRACTDDGHAVGILGLDDMVTTNAATFDQSGRITILDTCMSAAYATTPDGSYIAGALLNEMWLPTPCLWHNGQRIILPCPTEQECGIPNDGANAQYISADGSVVAGYIQDWTSSRPAIIWRRQQDGTYQYDIVSKGVWESKWGDGKPYLKFECLGISQNGKWLAIVAQKEAEGSMPTPEFMVRMNLETGEITESETPDILYFDPETNNIYPNSIADDGTCVGVAMDEMGYTRGVIWQADAHSAVLLSDLFPQFSTSLAEYDKFMHFPIAISADANTIGGYGILITQDAMGETDINYQSYRLVIDPSTSIADIHTSALPLATTAFTLTGHRVPANYQGIVIRCGKKYLK